MCDFEFKYEIDVAGLFFEPQPCNFSELNIFEIFSIDITYFSKIAIRKVSR